MTIALMRKLPDPVPGFKVGNTREKIKALTRTNLAPLIAFNGVQKVRITGVLFFDSEHSLGHHLIRKNNWEIHPILVLEYCRRGKRCTADSDDNWVTLDKPKKPGAGNISTRVTIEAFVADLTSGRFEAKIYTSQALECL